MPASDLWKAAPPADSAGACAELKSCSDFGRGSAAAATPLTKFIPKHVFYLSTQVDNNHSTQEPIKMYSDLLICQNFF